MLRLAAGTCGTVLLSACGAAPTIEPAAPTEAPAAEEITLEVWGFHPYMTEKNAEMIKRFTEDRPNTNITWVEAEDSLQKFLAAVAANQGIPDITAISCWEFPGMQKSGALPFIDLTDQVAAHRDEFFPQRLAVWEVSGKVYGVDWVMNPVIMYFRHDVVVDKLGADIPFDDWDDFIAAGLRAAEGGEERFLTSAMECSGDYLLDVLFQLRGAWFLTPEGEITLDTPDGVAALSLFREMVVEDKVMTDKLALFDSGWEAAFKEGRILGEIGPDWTTGALFEALPEQEGLWGAMPLPRAVEGGPRLGSAGGAAYMITKKCKYPDVAWDYVYFSNWTDEAAIVEFEISGSFPVTYSGLALPEIQADHYFFPKENNWNGSTWGEVVAELGEEQPVPVWPPGITEVMHVVDRVVIEPVLRGEIEPAEALAAAQREAEDLLK